MAKPEAKFINHKNFSLWANYTPKNKKLFIIIIIIHCLVPTFLNAFRV